MALLFKGGEQLYNEALDLIGRKDYDGARKKFSDAIGKNYDGGNLAQVYIAIIDIGKNRGNSKCYSTLIERLGSLNSSSLKFGLTDLEVEDLRTEAELDIKEIEAASISDSDFKKKGEALIACAGEFMGRIGEKNLKINEIFQGTTTATGNREALILQAQGYSILGKGTVHKDPKLAADYMQMAYNFRKQLGDSGEEELRLSQEFARSCTCWICGRPANAEGIHFRPIKSTVEPVFQKMTENDAVKPITDDAQAIYVCLPCYTAISNRSDEISRIYYDRAMEEMRAMEARLESQIRNLSFSVSMRR